MVNTVARVLSYIFHPLLIATYLFLLLSFTLPIALEPIQPASHLLFIGLVFIVTFLLPTLNLGILKIFGSLKSFEMIERRERILPFILISFIYVFVTYLFYNKTKLSINDNFLRLMIVIDLLVVVSTIATLFFKISIHSVAAWGVIGILIPLNKMTEINSLFYPSIAAIFVAGLIMSSRVQLGVHTLKEVLWGSVIGLATSVAGMSILFR
jgi:membrane-associated phospholipid phosphatase